MIEVDVVQLILCMGIPSAVTGFCFWLVEHRIQRREKQRDEQEAALQAEATAREKAREELECMIVRSNSAAIALAEATAKAVQRIPDAHCNGGMRAALEYAAKVKHEQKDFLTKLGLHSLHED